MSEPKSDIQHVTEGLARNPLTRRRLLQMGAGAVSLIAASSLLAACGGEAGETEDTETTGGAGSGATATTAATQASGSDASPAASGGTTGSDDCAGGELIYALSADPPNLDPHVSSGAAANAVKIQMYNGLARYWGETAEIQPDLAEKWEISDDGLTYTMNLRSGVTFHNGEAFTSADVKASIERVKDEATGAELVKEIGVISSVDTPDDTTAILTLSAPSAPLLSYLADTGSFILSSAFLSGGGDPNTEAIGTGAFKFGSREPGVRLEVVKNPDYYFPDYPKLDKIAFVPYPDEDTRMAALKGGEVDLAEYVPWKDYESIRGDSNLELHAGDAAAFMCTIYNVREKPFDDPKVRHALGYAFDRQAIIDIVFFGEGSPITGGLVPPDLWGHAADLQGTFSYDPDKAKQLLAEAGYPDGFDCRLLSTSQYGMHQGTAEIVQQNLQDIGINCELELYDWSTTVEKHTKGEYQFRVHGLGTGGADPDFMTNLFHSSGSFAQSDGFADDEIDRLLDEARKLTDPADRKPLYDQMQARLLELSPFTFLTYRVQAEATAARVKGYVHYPGGLFDTSAKSLEQATVNCP